MTQHYYYSPEPTVNLEIGVDITLGEPKPQGDGFSYPITSLTDKARNYFLKLKGKKSRKMVKRLIKYNK